MWQRFGNIKSNLEDITSKALSTAAKAGSRAKEIINQVDADDFFERELNVSPINPLEKPEVKPKNKDKELKINKVPQAAKKENPLNDFFANEESLDSPVVPNQNLPKVFSLKKQKENETSASNKTQGDSSEVNVTKSLEGMSPSFKSEKAEKEKSNIAKSSQDVFGRKEDSGISVSTGVSVDQTNNETWNRNQKAATREDNHEKNKVMEENKTEKTKVAKEQNNKEEKGSDPKEIKALKEALEANEEALHKFAEDNDKLIKEKNDLKELSNSFQQKVVTLDNNLTEVLEKNTHLEKQVHKLKQELTEARRTTGTSDIHSEIPSDRKEAIRNYIHNCLEEYKADISRKIIDNLNHDILSHIASEEEGIMEEVRELVHSWTARPEIFEESTRDIIQEEKIMKPFYEENLLREEIEREKDENHQLRSRTELLDERIKQLETQIERDQASFKEYREANEQTLKKYTEDFVKFEQKLENYEEDVSEYKAVLKARTEDIERLNATLEERNTEIKSLEEILKAETAAKEDLAQQYEGLVTGMKEFEKTMQDLNLDNEEKSTENKTLKAQLAEERKRAKDNEQSLSIDMKDKLLEKLSKLNALSKGLEVESIIDSKLMYKEGRVTLGTFLEALEHSLNMTTAMANKRFNSQLDEERIKEQEKYNALSKNFEKQQNELKEALKREKELQNIREELKRKNDEFTLMVDNMNSQGIKHANRIKELQKTIADLQETKKKYMDEVAAKNEEIEQLKIKFNSVLEEVQETANYVVKLEGETSVIPELSSKLEKQAIEISNLNEALRARDEENEHLNMTITNLQTVIDENQQIQENMSSQYTNEIKRLRGDLEQSTRKSQILQEYKEKFEAMEKEFKEKETKIKDLTVKLRETEQEKNSISAEAAALLKKAKNEAMYKEHLVDKRVVTSFLIKYFDFNATFAVKQGILETMSSILGFTDDERTKLGLPKQKPEPPEPVTKAKASSPLALHKAEKKFEEEKGNQSPATTEATEIPTTEETQQEKKDEKAGKEETTEKTEEKAPAPAKSLKQMFMSFLLEKE